MTGFYTKEVTSTDPGGHVTFSLDGRGTSIGSSLIQSILSKVKSLGFN
jgi:hypothetical protein